MTCRQKHYFLNPILKNQTIWFLKLLFYNQKLIFYIDQYKVCNFIEKSSGLYRFCCEIFTDFTEHLWWLLLTHVWAKPLLFVLCPFHNVPQKPNFQLLHQVHFFLRIVVYRIIFIDLENKTWVFLHFHIFSIYAGHAFLAIRAKYPSYCHFQTIYQSINVMKHDFFQCIRFEIVKKGK